MANIAIVFHWPPEVMDKMGIEELLEWHERARERYIDDVKARGLHFKKG